LKAIDEELSKEDLEVFRVVLAPVKPSKVRLGDPKSVYFDF
jgi:hypothetical protein